MSSENNQINAENVEKVNEDIQKVGKAGDKDYMRNYMRNYIKESQQVVCECGGKFKSYNKCLHKKTKKHILYEEMRGKNKNDDVDKLKQEIEILRKLILIK